MTRAYLAGYFDGEGSVSAAITAASRKRGGPPSIAITFSQRDRDALEQIRDDLGFGSIYTQRSSGCSHLQVTTRDDIVSLVRLIYPFVRQKRAQLRIAYRMASLTGGYRSGYRISPFDRDRRIALGDELQTLNARARTSGVANRHGGGRLEARAS